MTDHELRDKLANEHLWVIPAHFIEGWDAARENEYKPTLKLSDRGIYTVTANLAGWAAQERDRLRVSAEKLAEALEFISQNLGHPPSPPFPAPFAYSADKAREALAEYREKYPKEKTL